MSEGHYREAGPYAQQMLLEYEQSGRGDSLEAAMTIDRLLDIRERFMKTRTGDEALGLARRAVAIRERHFGPGSPETAASLVMLGRVHRERHEFDEALDVMRTAPDIVRKSPEPNGALVGEIDYQIGTVYIAKGQPIEAKAWFERALSVQEESLGRVSLPVARTIQELGGYCAATRSPSEALSRFRQALDIGEQVLGPGHPDLGPMLLALGWLQGEIGNFTEAIEYLERLLPIYTKSYGPDSLPTLRVNLVLSTQYARAGRFSQAQELLESAIEAVSRTDPSDIGALAALRWNHAYLLLDMRNWTKALELQRLADAFYQEREGETSLYLARGRINEGIALDQLGRHVEAEQVLEQALQTLAAAEGPDSLGVATALVPIATVRLNLGDAGGAKSAAESAMRIYSLDPEHHRDQIIGITETLADAAYESGQPLEALELYERRLGMALALTGDDHPSVAHARIKRATLLAELGRTEEAAAEAALGEAIFRESLLALAQGSAGSDAVAYAGNRGNGLDLLVTMATRAGAEQDAVVVAAADSLIRSRAIVLEELARRHRRSIGGGDMQSSGLVSELRRTSDRLSSLIIRGPRVDDQPPFPEALETARREKVRAERALAAHAAEFRVAQERSEAGIDETRSALPEGAALVGFVRYRAVPIDPRGPHDRPGPRAAAASYAAMILAPGRDPPAFVHLGTADKIEALVQQWRSELISEAYAAGRDSVGNETRYRKAAGALRETVWDPVQRRLGVAKQVFVVPDGALNIVNLAALPVGQREYLAETGLSLHYLSAERDLLLEPLNDWRSGDLLAVSNPDFDARTLVASAEAATAAAPVLAQDGATGIYRGTRSACGSFQSMRFDALPASSAEAKALAAVWQVGASTSTIITDAAGAGKGILAFSGAEATETAFKRNASGHRVLHLATHGFFLGDACGSALGEDSSTSGGAEAVASVTRENPLLLSGLVLAGANNRDAAGPEEDDGVLTAEEIAALDLAGTEWAVLSACNTGVGEIRSGEGVLGLRRAFQIAGARTVVMSLWPVEDEATRDWMTSLYRRRLLEGESTAQAVNGASLDLLGSRRAHGASTHPFYWAGFIAAGDWR